MALLPVDPRRAYRILNILERAARSAGLADAGALVVVKVEVVRKRRAQALEIVVVPGAQGVELLGRCAIGAARRVALEKLGAGGGAILGVEQDHGAQLAGGVDFGEAQVLPFEARPAAAPVPAGAVQGEPIARGGEELRFEACTGLDEEEIQPPQPGVHVAAYQ